MVSVVTIGLDLGKSVFQVHGVDAGGAVVIQRRLTRGKLLGFFAKQPPCLVGMEACAAAHHWGRELQKLGHAVRLMPPNYVKPYVKRQKNDAADAEAICEAVTRPNMRFVEIKTCEQQGTLVLHRVRLMLMRQRVQLSNAIRSHMAEYRLVAPEGRNGLQRLIAILGNPDDERFTPAGSTVVATQAINLSAGVWNARVLRGRSLSCPATFLDVPGRNPIGLSPSGSTAAAGQFCSRWSRAAKGFADRRSTRQCRLPMLSADDPQVPSHGPRSGIYTTRSAASWPAL
jgi:transposase